MLRILHTSDWHLGASFHGIDRSADEAAALQHLVELCRAREVDAVLVAGDVFDTAHPSADAQRRWFEALSRFVQEGGARQVVVIAGNHDSGARLDSPRAVLEPFRISVRGLLPVAADPAAALVFVQDRRGRVAALCAAVPYLREGDLCLPEGDEPLAVRQARAMAERFRAIREAAAAHAAAQGLPWMAVAHTYACGGQRGGDERPVLAEADIIGRLAGVDAASIAEGAAYAAFGHLHRPQAVAGREHWRYSGSLLPQAFDEADDRPNVVIADIDGAGPARVEALALPRHRRYASVSGEIDQVRAAIAALPAAERSEPTPLLAVSIVSRCEQRGVHQEIVDEAAARGWRVVRVQRIHTAACAAPHRMSVEAADLAELQPLDVLRHAHRSCYGSDPTPELEHAFLTLLADITGRA